MQKVDNLTLKLDLDTTRLSRIIELKQLFAEHRGTTPVTIDFLSNQAHVASLQIDTRWGITLSPDLLSALSQHLP